MSLQTKGLVASVYRDADGYDCTAGGLTSRFDTLVLYATPMRLLKPQGEYAIEYVEGPFAPSEKRPILFIHEVLRAGRSFLLAVPPSYFFTKHWHSFGGNFVYSSDSRFPTMSDRVKSPIPVHDRIEYANMDGNAVVPPWLLDTWLSEDPEYLKWRYHRLISKMTRGKS